MFLTNCIEKTGDGGHITETFPSRSTERLPVHNAEPQGLNMPEYDVHAHGSALSVAITGTFITK